MSDEKHWFIGRGEEEFGPFDSNELKEMATEGSFLSTDLVWKEGMKEWVPATQLKIQFPNAGRPPLPSQAGAGYPNQQGGPQYPRQRAQTSGSGCLVIGIVCAIVGVLVLALLAGILLPALGAARRTAKRMQNGTQVRGVQQAMILWSQANNSFYPGRTSSGSLIGPQAAALGKWGGAAPSSTDQSVVYALLMNGEFFTPEYIISPADELAVMPTLGPNGTTLVGTGGATGPNFSFGLLDFTTDSERSNEWKDTNNSQAPVVADPSSQIRSDLQTHTYHSPVSVKDAPTFNDYEGNVGWNDNHVSFEKSSQFAPGKIKLGSNANAAFLDIMAGGQGQAKMAFDK